MCVVVYFELEKFWCLMGTIQKVYVYFSFGNVMNVMCVLAGDIVSVVCRKASG